MLDAAGARLLGTVDLAEAIERLDRIASVRLIVLKAGANSPLLLELLQRIGRMAELDRIAAIVAVPHAGLDDAYAALGDAPVDLLCDPIEGDLTAAIALSLQAAQSTLLHDIGRERESLRDRKRAVAEHPVGRPARIGKQTGRARVGW